LSEIRNYSYELSAVAEYQILIRCQLCSQIKPILRALSPNQCSSLRRRSCCANHGPMGQVRDWLKGQPDFCYMAKFGNLARELNAAQLR
jgi:cytochrome c